MKIRNQLIAIVLCLSLLFLAACGSSSGNDKPSSETTETPTVSKESTESNETEKMYWELLNDVNDSSQLPTWEGETLNLRFWYSHGTSWGDSPVVKPNDVVIKEIERVTGIVIDVENSFDNNGVAISAKLPMLVASGDYPEIVFNGQQSNLSELIEADKLHDLTDVFDEYCDQFASKMPRDKFQVFYELNHQYNGRQYTLPTGVSGYDYYYIDPEAFPEVDEERYQTNIIAPTSRGNLNGNNMLWVRDDILQALYPDAKSLEEIKEIYETNGTFTRDEIFDVPLETFEDFTDMLYDIKDYIAKEQLTSESGHLMEVTYGPAVGQDNWGWMKILPELVDGVLGETNYFTQFNKKTEQLELAYEMDYVINEMKVLNTLVNDDVIAKDSLVDNATAQTQKIENSNYAVLYMYAPPNHMLEEAGKDYRYRPVWVDQEYREDQQAAFLQYAIGQAFGIFKDTVSEEDLPQVLHFFNYLYSDVGSNMLQWGPESAGLFDVVDGKKVYKDSALEACMLYGEDNGQNAEYGLITDRVGQQPFFVLPQGINFVVNSPQYVYDVSKNSANALKYFNPGILPGESIYDVATRVPKLPNVYNYTNEVESIEQFWAAREGFEKQMIKVIAAETEAQFDTQYQLLIQYAEANGLTEETLAELNEVYLETNGEALKDGGLIK